MKSKRVSRGFESIDHGCLIPRYLLKLWRFTGVLASLLACCTIAVSIYFNPWFNFFKHAFSDLGGPRAHLPWLFNLGLVTTGAIACIYSLYLAYVGRGKLDVFCSALLFTAGIFLALIGIFPTPSRYHVFVSTWFFVQMWLSLMSYAINFGVKKELRTFTLLLAVSVAGPAAAIAIEHLVKWPSTASIEAYGIALINMGVITLTMKY